MSNRAQDLLAPLTAPKLPIVYAKGSLRFKQIKLDAAITSQEVNLEGGGGADFVYFDELSTAQTGATMTIDDESSTAKLPVGPLRGFRDLPCKRVFITCPTAITGGVLNMWYGKGTYLYGMMPAGKGQWYDRNPAPQGLEYEGLNIAPHVNTLRVSYTVPAAKKAIVEGLSLDICRVTAAAPVGVYQAYWYVVTSGANAHMPRMKMLTNNIGDRAGAIANGAMFLGAGDQVQGATGDASTGGTVNYTLGMKATQFDA